MGGTTPLDVEAAVAVLDAALRTAGTPERASGEKRYLKSALDFYGVTVPTIARLARDFTRSRPELSAPELLATAAALWQVGVHERRMLAAQLLSLRNDLLRLSDAPFLEGLIRESRTWALVDSIAPYAVGRLAQRETRFEKVLDRWAVDADFWVKRAALLASLLPLREGADSFEPFARRADRMLEEREFFVRKAIGWVLRERSKVRPDEVFEWLLPRAARASGLTLREASKYLSDEQKVALRTAASGEVAERRR